MMFDFSRRINRATYYAGIGIVLFVVIGASLLSALPTFGDVIDTIIGLTIVLIALILFVYLVCLVRQRANDIGWHPLLATLIAFSIPFAFLILGLIPGQKTANRFGAVPEPGVRLKR